MLRNCRTKNAEMFAFRNFRCRHDVKMFAKKNEKWVQRSSRISTFGLFAQFAIGRLFLKGCPLLLCGLGLIHSQDQCLMINIDQDTEICFDSVRKRIG